MSEATDFVTKREACALTGMQLPHLLRLASLGRIKTVALFGTPIQFDRNDCLAVARPGNKNSRLGVAPKTG